MSVAILAQDYQLYSNNTVPMMLLGLFIMACSGTQVPRTDGDDAPKVGSYIQELLLAPEDPAETPAEEPIGLDHIFQFETEEEDDTTTTTTTLPPDPSTRWSETNTEQQLREDSEVCRRVCEARVGPPGEYWHDHLHVTPSSLWSVLETSSETEDEDSPDTEHDNVPEGNAKNDAADAEDAEDMAEPWWSEPVDDTAPSSSNVPAERRRSARYEVEDRGRKRKRE